MSSSDKWSRWRIPPLSLELDNAIYCWERLQPRKTATLAEKESERMPPDGLEVTAGLEGGKPSKIAHSNCSEQSDYSQA